MRVLCSVLLRGVGHIRQLYPRDNWPDRDAKQVWRHFEERARSQVRDTTKPISFPDLSPGPDYHHAHDILPYVKGYVIAITLSALFHLASLSCDTHTHHYYPCYSFSVTCTRSRTRVTLPVFLSFFLSLLRSCVSRWMQPLDRSTYKH